MSLTYAITPATKKILDNFAKISPELTLVSGDTQRATGPGDSSSVLVSARLPTPWPAQTAIYNLDKLLGVISMYESPVLEFGDDNLTIQNADRTTGAVFKLSDPSTIPTPPSRNFPVDNPVVEFPLSKASLDALKKSAALLNLTQFTVHAGPKVPTSVIAFDEKTKKKGHQFVHTVTGSEGTASKKFAITCLVEHLNLILDGDYIVRASDEWSYLYFAHQTFNVTYLIAKAIEK